MNRFVTLMWLGVGVGCASVGCDEAGGEGAAPMETPPSTARPLDVVSRTVELDPRDEAVATFRRDAHRREARFLEALAPGQAFASTRVTQAEIDAGRWTTEALFRLGGQLFDLDFTPREGLGRAGVSTLVRVHTGQLGGPDATRCSSCHWRGGRAGAGDGADNVFFDGDGDRPASALTRNPIALVGAGWLERAASEMTVALQARRAELVRSAAARGAAVSGLISAKGVDFGTLTAHPDGRVDTSELAGVDPDLVIKPFGWKGRFATVREMVEESLRVHHGMQSGHLVAHGPSEILGDGPPEDPDDDGVVAEIIEGQVTALSLFVALQGVPVETPPRDTRMSIAWGRGRTRFDAIGCAECHVPSLRIESSVFTMGNRLGGPPTTVDLATEGASPQIVPSARGRLEVRLFSDLRRHEMGPELAESRAEGGVAAPVFLTPPLWGLARSRPYLHDGRAPTLEDAILLHGGEAAASRDAYAGLDDEARAELRIFLISLTRARQFTVR